MLLVNMMKLQKKWGVQIEEYLKKNLINIVGGCCGTGPEHIRVIANLAATYEPRDLIMNLISESHY